MKLHALFCAAAFLTAPLRAQLPLNTLEHPAWSTGATPFPALAGSAVSIVTRAQSHSGAQSVQIPVPVPATNPLHAFKVNGTIDSGGGYTSLTSTSSPRP